MSAVLEIVDETGEGRVVEKIAPWIVGGDREADLCLPGAPETALAYIGCEGGHFFIQPADPAVGLHRNGRPVGASVWIGDGDRLVVGGHRLRCSLHDGCLRIEFLGRLAPATGVTSQGAPAGASAPPVAPEYRPRPYRPPESRMRRRLRYAIYAGFAALALAAGFVLFAVPVEITVTPAPESLRVDGFPPTVTVAGRRLALPGTYRVEARREGYYPLSEDISVAGDSREFSLAMEKLPGKLFLKVAPANAGAWVSLDGETLGRAPLKGREVPAGEHRLGVTAERYLPLERDLTVRGMGEAERLEIVLEPAWANVTVLSVPDGAGILLDDEEAGTTPEALEVLQGTHTVRLEKEEYAPESLEIEVAAGVAQTVGPVELIPLPGSLVLSSDPPGAAFTAGNRFLGRGPLETRLAPRRRHEVTAVLPGYTRAETSVTLAPGERRRLTLTLEPEFGTVFVRADPPDARLEVNGEPVGRAVRRLRLQTVAHRIRITKDGYAPYETTVIPKADLSNEIAVTLRPMSEIERLGLTETLVTAAGQALRLMGPAAFTMGADRREPGRRANEIERDVALTRRFYLSERLVTNAQFRAFREGHSSGIAGRKTLNLDDQPAVGVSWEDAARYLNWLSLKDGLEPAYEEVGDTLRLRRPVGTGYRFPTEAEWAWAARMAKRPARARYAWGETYPPAGKAGNFADESARGIVPVVIEGYDDGFAVTAPVGSFPANPAGFYDMPGNVAEWMGDYYDITPPVGTVAENPLGPDTGNHHVVRGAGWRHATPTRLRLSFRDYSSEPREDIGFRIARYAREP